MRDLPSGTVTFLFSDIERSTRTTAALGDERYADLQDIQGYTWPDGARIRVGIGIHTGEAVLREDNYVGRDVNMASRVQDAGHGGQVLLSELTAKLVGDRFELIELGPHRLKEIDEPQRLVQVGTGSFPALRVPHAFLRNLPAQRTSFIGRAAELDRLVALVREHRLVTLTGVGGVGKTRLALHAAEHLLAA